MRCKVGLERIRVTFLSPEGPVDNSSRNDEHASVDEEDSTPEEVEQVNKQCQDGDSGELVVLEGELIGLTGRFIHAVEGEVEEEPEVDEQHQKSSQHKGHDQQLAVVLEELVGLVYVTHSCLDPGLVTPEDA